MSIPQDWATIRQLATDCFNIVGARVNHVCLSVEWGPQIGTPSGTIVIQGTNPTPHQMAVLTDKARGIRSIIQQYPAVTNDSVRVIYANGSDPNIDCPPPPPGSPEPLFDPVLIPTKGPQNGFKLNLS